MNEQRNPIRKVGENENQDNIKFPIPLTGRNPISQKKTNKSGGNINEAISDSGGGVSLRRSAVYCCMPGPRRRSRPARTRTNCRVITSFVFPHLPRERAILFLESKWRPLLDI